MKQFCFMREEISVGFLFQKQIEVFLSNFDNLKELLYYLLYMASETLLELRLKIFMSDVRSKLTP